MTNLKATDDRFDAVMVAVVVVLVFVIGVVIVRGDQVGLSVRSFSPKDTASSRAIIRLQLDQPIIASSAIHNFTITPGVRGKLSIAQDQITFQPSEAFKQGQDYTVTVKAGIQGSAGRTLKQDVQWQFRVMPPLILYAGPGDNIIENLFVVDPSQPESPRQLTDAAKGVVGYDIASDGSKVVYSEAQEDGSTKLKLLDTSTGQSRIVYDCPDATCTSPAWRPDGGAIAFERVELNLGTGLGPGVTRVWVLDVATGNAGPLFKDSQQLGYGPHWSLDGTKLAVFNLNAGGVVIHDFTNQTDQTIPTVQGEVGNFSPDGKWISFLKVVNPNTNNSVTHAVLVDISQGQYIQHDLVPDSDPVNDVEALWTPDSKHLIVARRTQSTDVTSMAGTQLYGVEIDTGRATPLVVDTAYDNNHIQISPSGDTILFQRFPFDKPGGRTELWTYNTTTQVLTKVVENANFGHWLP